MVNENVSDRVTFETLWQKYIAEIAKILISSIVGLFTPRKLLNQHA